MSLCGVHTYSTHVAHSLWSTLTSTHTHTPSHSRSTHTFHQGLWRSIKRSSLASLGNRANGNRAPDPDLNLLWLEHNCLISEAYFGGNLLTEGWGHWRHWLTSERIAAGPATCWKQQWETRETFKFHQWRTLLSTLCSIFPLSACNQWHFDMPSLFLIF